jgi:hypothetical protein
MRQEDEQEADAAPPPAAASGIVPATAAPSAPAPDGGPSAEAAVDPPRENGGGEGEGRTRLADVTSTIADAAQAGMAVARPLLSGVEGLASGARRVIDERTGARVRAVRRMGRKPLLNLWDVHPEARRAAIRELGLQTVPVDAIAGTAVEGAPQRGGDFLPLRGRRSDDWRARWQRIMKAVDGLANLPPVELIRFGDRYWVVDGHNRVAAALYNGQVAIDAEVDELRLAGVARDRTPTSIASVLEGSSDVRQAGAGRLTRTSSRPQRLPRELKPDHGHRRDRERREDNRGPDGPDPAR